MNHMTVSGRYSTDPLFDPRSLRPGYQEWHEIIVPVEDREPIIGAALTLSYVLRVAYTDAGDRKVIDVGLMIYQSMEDKRRGREPQFQTLNPYDPAEAGLIALIMRDAESKVVKDAIESDVRKHQADRDEDYES